MLITVLFWKRQLTVDDLRTNTKQKTEHHEGMDITRKLNLRWATAYDDVDYGYDDYDYDVGYDDNGKEVVEEEEENEKHDLPLSSVG